MKKLKNILGVLLVVALLTVSCDKSDGEIITQGLDYSNIKGFFEANGVQGQEFTIDAATGGSITGAEGTVVTFPANSFVDGNNNPVTGTINIVIKEIFKPSQMILSNKPTNAIGLDGSNTFLLSEGETEVIVSQNGVELQLASHMSYKIRVPSAGGEDDDMLPFQGVASDEQGIIWKVDGGSRTSAEYDPAPGSYLYEVFDTGWYNCDKFYTFSGIKTTNFVNLTASPNQSETAVYVIYKENNLPAVVKFSTSYNNGVQSYVDMLPVGLNITYVAITLKNNQQYLAVENVTISENEELTLNFEAKTTQEILDALTLLD